MSGEHFGGVPASREVLIEWRRARARLATAQRDEVAAYQSLAHDEVTWGVYTSVRDALLEAREAESLAMSAVAEDADRTMGDDDQDGEPDPTGPSLAEVLTPAERSTEVPQELRAAVLAAINEYETRKRAHAERRRWWRDRDAAAEHDVRLRRAWGGA